MALPTAWDVNDTSFPNVYLNDGLEVNYIDYSGNHDAVIRTDNPIPSQCKLFYFEIDVIYNENNKTIAIGFCSESAELNKMPGCEKNSWGYHSDDGNFFERSKIDMPYGPTFTTGDTIGCCLNFRNNTAFYTKNGVNLGIAFRDLKDNLYPCIGIKSGASIKANFGYEFKYAAMTVDDTDVLIKDRWFYFVMGEYKKALEDLTKLLEIDPNNAFALRYRGETYLLLNEYEKSYADVKRLLSTGNYEDVEKVAKEL
ncbi:SPRY-domain-containing protein [Gigaspora margarita]|uniref:SPRY-domain-containing protein n=1 Tax=Gigaspora margarita TaxID=4874 RepID=A0A8H3XJC4_GIGMA|nr:SPRY-domain-containing protein [Gigaspora margarita]